MNEQEIEAQSSQEGEGPDKRLALVALAILALYLDGGAERDLPGWSLGASMTGGFAPGGIPIFTHPNLTPSFLLPSEIKSDKINS